MQPLKTEKPFIKSLKGGLPDPINPAGRDRFSEYVGDLNSKRTVVESFEIGEGLHSVLLRVIDSVERGFSVINPFFSPNPEKSFAVRSVEGILSELAESPAETAAESVEAVAGLEPAASEAEASAAAGQTGEERSEGFLFSEVGPHLEKSLKRVFYLAAYAEGLHASGDVGGINSLMQLTFEELKEFAAFVYANLIFTAAEPAKYSRADVLRAGFVCEYDSVHRLPPGKREYINARDLWYKIAKPFFPRFAAAAFFIIDPGSYKGTVYENFGNAVPPPKKGEGRKPILAYVKEGNVKGWMATYGGTGRQLVDFILFWGIKYEDLGIRKENPSVDANVWGTGPVVMVMSEKDAAFRSLAGVPGWYGFTSLGGRGTAHRSEIEGLYNILSGKRGNFVLTRWKWLQETVQDFKAIFREFQRRPFFLYSITDADPSGIKIMQVARKQFADAGIPVHNYRILWESYMRHPPNGSEFARILTEEVLATVPYNIKTKSGWSDLLNDKCWTGWDVPPVNVVRDKCEPPSDAKGVEINAFTGLSKEAFRDAVLRAITEHGYWIEGTPPPLDADPKNVTFKFGSPDSGGIFKNVKWTLISEKGQNVEGGGTWMPLVWSDTEVINPKTAWLHERIMVGSVSEHFRSIDRPDPTGVVAPFVESSLFRTMFGRLMLDAERVAVRLRSKFEEMKRIKIERILERVRGIREIDKEKRRDITHEQLNRMLYERARSRENPMGPFRGIVETEIGLTVLRSAVWTLPASVYLSVERVFDVD